MLTSLSIKNFALIEDVNLQLQEGFTTITGETGAGKSILLGALSLLLGKRADLNAIRNPEKKCVVEGHFAIEAYQLQAFFEDEALDYEAQTIIRRELLPSGKSRAFINDTPVRLQQLQQLGSQLVDIHSQHETLYIGDEGYQYNVIDALAGNASVLADFKSALKKYQQLNQQLVQLKADQKEAAATYDYNLFLLNELKEADLKEGMQESLEAEYQALNNVEVLKETLSQAVYHLQQEEIGILERLQEVKSGFGQLQAFGDQYQALFTRLESSLLELEDVNVEIERLQTRVEDDPERLTVVNDKLQQLYSLQQKHHTDDIAELLTLQERLTEKVATTDNAENRLAAMERELESLKKEAATIAKTLYKNRQQAIKGFTTQVEEVLAQVGMPDARIKVQLTPTDKLSALGMDSMQWELAANKGSGFLPIKKAASGGELSRITLAVKSILAQYSKLPTIIFDEIDTGVSGDVAQKMGNILSKMAADLQVIAITHLPQIAAKGNAHLKVYKDTTDEVTATHIKVLTGEHRINELAEMLGGKEKSDSAIAHAKALLS